MFINNGINICHCFRTVYKYFPETRQYNYVKSRLNSSNTSGLKEILKATQGVMWSAFKTYLCNIWLEKKTIMSVNTTKCFDMFTCSVACFLQSSLQFIFRFVKRSKPKLSLCIVFKAYNCCSCSLWIDTNLHIYKYETSITRTLSIVHLYICISRLQVDRP